VVGWTRGIDCLLWVENRLSHEGGKRTLLAGAGAASIEDFEGDEPVKRWLLFLTPLLVVGGCAGRTPGQSSFPAAYELVADGGRTAVSSEVMIYLYDDASRMTAIARRDDASVGIGGYDQMNACDAGDYCVRIDEAPGPLIVFIEPASSLSFDGWRYEVERNVLEHEQCDRFTARQPIREDWFSYLHCGGLGITSITTFQGGAVAKAFQLRSYLGLGASAR
tara:strand:- start:659 stop:1321 length:663 start_codon:yes stop_codon:yes gene_type:complete